MGPERLAAFRGRSKDLSRFLAPLVKGHRRVRVLQHSAVAEVAFVRLPFGEEAELRALKIAAKSLR